MGIRRLTYHFRAQCRIFVSRMSIWTTLKAVDPVGLEWRRRRRLTRRVFHCKGPNAVWSCDGYDKLSRWGFAIHGGIDVYSRNLVWLRLAHSNRDPRVILAYYLDAIDENTSNFGGQGFAAPYVANSEAIVPAKVQTDYGTETTELYAAQYTFHELGVNGDTGKCYRYSRSVQNQKIECYWSQLVTHWTGRWQNIFGALEFSELWNYDDKFDKLALVYIFMPILRRELVDVRRDHNSYPIRSNHLSRLPSGPPEDNYLFGPTEEVSYVIVDAEWTNVMRRFRLPSFDVDEYILPDTIVQLDSIMLESPQGPNVDVSNARQQYLFLRDQLHQRLEWPE
jgi:hypothetical protein